MPTMTPCLWFDGNAEEAFAFYQSIFPDTTVLDTMRSGDAGPGVQGSVLTLRVRLLNLEIMALNGGPHFTFTPAISFFVSCDTQAEVDHIWDRLLEGGKPQRCGWLTDRFGLSWQVVPALLGTLLKDADPQRSARVMAAMMGMVKLDAAALRQAYDGA